jgi:hypothetical protein
MVQLDAERLMRAFMGAISSAPYAIAAERALDLNAKVFGGEPWTLVFQNGPANFAALELFLLGIAKPVGYRPRSAVNRGRGNGRDTSRSCGTECPTWHPSEQGFSVNWRREMSDS